MIEAHYENDKDNESLTIIKMARSTTQHNKSSKWSQRVEATLMGRKRPYRVEAKDNLVFKKKKKLCEN